MLRVLVFVLASGAAILAETRSGDAAEIVTGCPRINDSGSFIETRTLLPSALTPLDPQQRELLSPFGIAEISRVYWRPGVDPITDAIFFCTYRDKSVLHIPILGMLIHCKAWAGPYIPANNQITWCTSETDPGLLLNK